MCGRFTPLMLDQVTEVVRELHKDDDQPSQLRLMKPDQELDVRPGDNAFAIVEGVEGLAPQELTWGFDVSWSKRLVFNTRIERAYDNHGMWTDSFASGRCIVPAFSFFEPHRAQTERNPKTGRPMKSQYVFTDNNLSILLMAGVFQGSRFSVVTTVADDVVKPIHDRMPLLLDTVSARKWLSRGYRDVTASRISLAANREIRSGGQLSLL